MTVIGTTDTACRTRRCFDVSFHWYCVDTPIDSEGHPESAATLEQFVEWIEANGENYIAYSTQLPVGTCGILEGLFPNRNFAVIPENFQQGSWTAPEYLVAGTRSAKFWKLLAEELDVRLIPMSPESAEMVKHARNGFLAMSIQYAHEIATVAEKHGADANDVAQALRLDPRIGPKAYVLPEGEPGPHLMREVHNLADLGGGPLIDALESLCSR